MKKEIKEKIKKMKENLQNEFIDGDDEITKKVREFWFVSSPFVGMDGGNFVKDLRDFVKNLLFQEKQKWREELGKKIGKMKRKRLKNKEVGYGSIQEDLGFNQAIDEIIKLLELKVAQK